MTRTPINPETQKQATGDRQQATDNEEPARGPRNPLRIGSDIAQRLIWFATEVLRIARTLPKDPPTRHVAQQVTRSATSSGANYEEARGAESKADFIHKLGVSAKEVRETMYWLQLIEAARLSKLDVDPLIGEAVELCAILGASIRTARRSD
jgi:four helix bundle protein